MKNKFIFLPLRSCEFIKDEEAATPASWRRKKRISGVAPTVNYQKSWSALSETACRRGKMWVEIKRWILHLMSLIRVDD